VFDLKAPVKLNIVCFSVKGADRDRINRAIVEKLHVDGIAAPSITLIGGVAKIRCAIVNHRTTAADIDSFVRSVHEVAAETIAIAASTAESVNA
jgi:hypothetical protein